MQKPYPSSTERFHSNFQIQRELPEILNTDPDHVPEAAAALIFLLDPQNSYMTGETLTIDGGMAAGL